MTAIFGILTSRLAGFIGIGAAVALAIALGVQTFKLYGAKRSAAKWEAAAATWKDAFAKEKKAYEQCVINRKRLDLALDRQSGEVRAIGAEGQRKLEATAKALEAADARAAKFQRDAAVLARKPQSATACGRFDDLDKALLETLP